MNSGPNKLSSRYPNISDLAHKDTFASQMNFVSTVDPESFDFIPPSYKLPDPQEFARFSAYKEAHPNATFIAKPTSGGCGDNIFLFKELRELP